MITSLDWFFFPSLAMEMPAPLLYGLAWVCTDMEAQNTAFKLQVPVHAQDTVLPRQEWHDAGRHSSYLYRHSCIKDRGSK